MKLIKLINHGHIQWGKTLDFILICLAVIITGLNLNAQQTCYAIKDNSDINATLYSWNENGVLTTIGDLNTEAVETMSFNGSCNEIYTTSKGNFGKVSLTSGLFSVISDLGDMNNPTFGLEDINDVDGMAIDNLSFDF